ncbi:DNA repair protein RadC [bacterium]|nr:DNA repair protein RadC [bacterium]
MSKAERRLLLGEEGLIRDDHLLGAFLSPLGIRQAGFTARRMLRIYGNLHSLARSTPGEWKEEVGLDLRAALALSAGMELGRRARDPRLGERPRILEPSAVYRLLGRKMESLRQEQFHILLLDSQHRLIRDCLVSQGSLNAAVVHPREVLRPAILASAQAVVMVHNHPSGDPEPSEEDVRLTLRMEEACGLLGIELLDHIVLGAEGFRSLREGGYLS